MYLSAFGYIRSINTTFVKQDIQMHLTFVFQSVNLRNNQAVNVYPLFVILMEIFKIATVLTMRL